MFSKSLITIAGLLLDIYGLKEYQLLPEGTPLVVAFFFNGVLQTQEEVEQSCQNICTLNDLWEPNNRYLIVISINQLRIESRNAQNIGLYYKTGSDQPQLTDIQMYYSAKSVAYAISKVMENLDTLIFGTRFTSFVQDWGVIGFSTGGIAAELTAAFEPKISTVILMGCSIDIKKWFPRMTHALRLEVHSHNQTFLSSATRNMAFDLRSKKLLVLNKSDDEIAPGTINGSSIEVLRRIHTGKEGHDWKAINVPGSKHTINENYIVNAKEWISKWLVSNSRYNYARI